MRNATAIEGIAVAAPAGGAKADVRRSDRISSLRDPDDLVRLQGQPPARVARGNRSTAALRRGEPVRPVHGLQPMVAEGEGGQGVEVEAALRKDQLQLVPAAPAPGGSRPSG